MNKSEKTSNKRHLKVYRKFVPRSYRKHAIFPEIRLCGKWLREIGFDCEKNITVQHMKNKIIITLDNTDKKKS